jgi:catechol 2,3-dioxygenase-like lactoylglutathione lyase family enzyme
MKHLISGIQQMGIGVPNVNQIWTWYRNNLGIDIKVFEEAAPAPLMTQYTGGIVQKRTATLALSMDGGGGFEIWQYTSRNTEKSSFEIRLGDYGLYACKIKSRDVRATFEYLTSKGVTLKSKLSTTPEGKPHFFMEDPNGNLFEVIEGLDWFSDTDFPSKTGGVCGSIINVSDIEKSLTLYSTILGYTEIVYDDTKIFSDLKNLNGGEEIVRRVLLRHPEKRKGPFSELLGSSEIELIQAINRTDCRPIFENRYWGDWGFIHLCFDVQGMDSLKKTCAEHHFAFTIDSDQTFDMGEAGGRFSYIEDPDGTLIEFVETHKVPLIKKIGWYIHLKNRNPQKKLPTWMLKFMRFNRFKN